MTDQTEQANSSGTAESTGNATSAQGKAYSQEELNRMFAERSSQAERSLLKKLGFEKVEDAESILRKARERDESEKSELQKAQELAAQREKQIQDLLNAQKTMATQNEVTQAAAKLGIVDPDAAYKLLDKEAIEYEGDGKPKNVEALLQSLLKGKPYLAGSGTSATNPSKRAGSEIDPMILAARSAAGLDRKDK